MMGDVIRIPEPCQPERVIVLWRRSSDKSLVANSDFSSRARRVNTIRQFEIESPITVGVRDLSNGHGIEFGQLREISGAGARFVLHRTLAKGTPVVLLVHFLDPHNRSTTIRFEGEVIGSTRKTDFEVTLAFRSGAQIFPGGFQDFLECHADGRKLEGNAAAAVRKRVRGVRKDPEARRLDAD